MSPHVGNFVQDLVEMAKATERLPGLEAELAKAHDDIETYAKQVQDREMHIIELKAEIDAKNEVIRSLEVAKDQAETMFLELDEKAGKVLAIRSDIADKINAMFDLLEPPKPQPEPVKAEPEHVAIHSWDEPGNVDQAHSDFGPIEAGVGQGEADPIASSEASSQTAFGSTETTAAPTTFNGPYSGLRYYDHPSYVAYDRWIEGGGTDADYHWRPEAKRTVW